MPRFFPVAEPLIGERELANVSDAVRSGWVSSLGDYIVAFEGGFARACQRPHGVAVANGTVALHLALHALGVGPGDEVLVPDLTFVATAHAVLMTGATPVLVDVEHEYGNLDPRAVERAITSRTRAIVVVHLYGHPADMDAIALLAADGIHLIEDAAEAHGARIGEKVVGSFGIASTFSFYGNKIITTGEGGMVLTSDDALNERLRLLRDHGMSRERRYYHTELAFNYRMTNVQAAIGVAQLERLAEFVEKKRSIARSYAERLADRPELHFAVDRAGSMSVHWMTSPVVREDVDRDALLAKLKARGVDTRPFFVPMSELPHLSACRTVGADGDSCPVARALSRRGFNLPSSCTLHEEDIDAICAIVREALT